MNLSYLLLDPTGNITLLVETPVPADLQPAAARQLMAREPGAEQVGFVSLSDEGPFLRMAGGEFCGNAALASAAWYLLRTGRSAGTVNVRVSGTEEPVPVSIDSLAGGRWRGTVAMPRPLSADREIFPDDRSLPVIRFPGIAHVILEETMDRKAAEALAPQWCAHLGTEALGLMFLDRTRETLRPLVYVPAADTLFWESSCASGTTAVGAFLALKAGGPVDLALSEPGGTLSIAAEPSGRLLLSGYVQLLRSRTAVIDLQA